MSDDTTKPQNSEATGSAAVDQGMRHSGPRPDKDGAEPGGRFKGRKRRKVSYLTINKIDHVDYKEINILRRFLNDRGKILPSRQTGNTARQQRMIANAIRRAREMALLPFVVTEMTDRREAGPRRERYNDRPRYEDQAPRASQQDAVEAAPAAEAGE